jgi:uncharacterized membrane protein HdeD (DUF308 family)
MLAGALPLLLLPGRINPRLITTGLAVWLLVEAIQTIIGAVGLRRSGKSWLPWLLIGAASVLFALFIVARDQFAFFVTGLAVLVWALGRGLMSLFVAWRLRGTSLHRWALVAEGVLGVTTGVLLLTVPQLAGPLLRYALGGYLAVSGVTSLAFAWSIHRETRARVRRFVGGGEAARG